MCSSRACVREQIDRRPRFVHEHVHTGPIAFVFAGFAAIIMIQLTRLAAAELVKRQTTEPAGKVLGSLVHFG